MKGRFIFLCVLVLALELDIGSAARRTTRTPPPPPPPESSDSSSLADAVIETSEEEDSPRNKDTYISDGGFVKIDDQYADGSEEYIYPPYEQSDEEIVREPPLTRRYVREEQIVKKQKASGEDGSETDESDTDDSESDEEERDDLSSLDDEDEEDPDAEFVPEEDEEEDEDEDGDEGEVEEDLSIEEITVEETPFRRTRASQKPVAKTPARKGEAAAEIPPVTETPTRKSSVRKGKAFPAEKAAEKKTVTETPSRKPSVRKSTATEKPVTEAEETPTKGRGRGRPRTSTPKEDPEVVNNLAEQLKKLNIAPGRKPKKDDEAFKPGNTDEEEEEEKPKTRAGKRGKTSGTSKTTEESPPRATPSKSQPANPSDDPEIYLLEIDNYNWKRINNVWYPPFEDSEFEAATLKSGAPRVTPKKINGQTKPIRPENRPEPQNFWREIKGHNHFSYAPVIPNDIIAKLTKENGRLATLDPKQAAKERAKAAKTAKRANTATKAAKEVAKATPSAAKDETKASEKPEKKGKEVVPPYPTEHYKRLDKKKEDDIIRIIPRGNRAVTKKALPNNDWEVFREVQGKSFAPKGTTAKVAKAKKLAELKQAFPPGVTPIRMTKIYGHDAPYYDKSIFVGFVKKVDGKEQPRIARIDKKALSEDEKTPPGWQLPEGEGYINGYKPLDGYLKPDAIPQNPKEVIDKYKVTRVNPDKNFNNRVVPDFWKDTPVVKKPQQKWWEVQDRHFNVNYKLTPEDSEQSQGPKTPRKKKGKAAEVLSPPSDETIPAILQGRDFTKPQIIEVTEDIVIKSKGNLGLGEDAPPPEELHKTTAFEHMCKIEVCSYSVFKSGLLLRKDRVIQPYAWVNPKATKLVSDKGTPPKMETKADKKRRGHLFINNQETVRRYCPGDPQKIREFKCVRGSMFEKKSEKGMQPQQFGECQNNYLPQMFYRPDSKCNPDDSKSFSLYAGYVYPSAADPNKPAYYFAVEMCMNGVVKMPYWSKVYLFGANSEGRCSTRTGEFVEPPPGFYSQPITTSFSKENKKRAYGIFLGLEAAFDWFGGDDKGHLIPIMDLNLYATQLASYVYENQEAQHATINEGGHMYTEKLHRDKAEQLGLVVQVTGPLYYIRLSDIRFKEYNHDWYNYLMTTEERNVYETEFVNYPERIFYLDFNNKEIPFNKYYWKILYSPDDNEGIVTITSNIPIKHEVDKFCPDVCNDYNWLLTVNRYLFNTGFIYCCEVPAFLQTFPYITKSLKDDLRASWTSIKPLKFSEEDPTASKKKKKIEA